jgi:hypothetical protein
MADEQLSLLKTQVGPSCASALKRTSLPFCDPPRSGSAMVKLIMKFNDWQMKYEPPKSVNLIGRHINLTPSMRWP